MHQDSGDESSKVSISEYILKAQSVGFAVKCKRISQG